MSQYILKEVLNCTVLDYATQTPITYIDYAETTEINHTAQRLKVNGGQGGYLQGVYDYNKESMLNLKLPLVDAGFLAFLSGDTLATGAENLFTREVVTISGGTATLSQTPVANTTPSVNILQGTRDFGTPVTVVTSAPTAQQCSISGKTITFGSGNTSGQAVVVYQYSSASTTTAYSATANQQVRPITIIGSGILLDQVAGTFIGSNIRIYQARPDQNFKLTMDMKATTTIDIKMDLIPQNVSGKMKFYDFNFLT